MKQFTCERISPNMQQQLYSNFDRLRLPLIILVVFIHAQFSAPEMETSMSLYGAVSHFFTLEISQVAVPLFFFISGCLYFRDYKEFTFSLYCKKQKRRVRSLIIPYLTWNTFFWLLFSLFILFVPTMVNGGIPNIANATGNDIAWVYWGNATGGPIDFPLWFIRDLMVITFLSPLVYIMVMKYRFGVFIILLLACLWIFAVPVHFLGNNICKCLFFFSLGSILNKVELDEETIKTALWGGYFIIVSFVLLAIISTINSLLWKQSELSLLTNRLIIFLGIPAMYALVDKYHVFFDKCKIIIPADCVFFIFASHGFLITLLKRVIERMGLENQLVLMAVYFTIVFVTIALCIILYKILRLFTPKLLVLLTGR